VGEEKCSGANGGDWVGNTFSFNVRCGAVDAMTTDTGSVSGVYEKER
jgi:hypothetical protein